MVTRTPEQGRDRERDLERLLTFVDAIVAIAITLLVLPLVELVGDLGDDGSVRGLLSDHRAVIGAFFLSFVVIARIWLLQHRILSNVVASSETLTRLLLVWALTIVVLPFPTALVSAASGVSSQTATKVLYVGTMAASSLVLSCACLVVARHDDLRDSSEAPDVVRSFAGSAAFLVALLVMLVAPATGFWPLLLLAVPDRAIDLWRRSHPRTSH